ncbi:Protein JINGUBANG [Zea mays]|uniref:Protein JINGUBANG n=1 Tax=Zea mays TaxID=4577 RepID=A0A3L6FN76_MAIZE|nr:Protein JINGUBANG [Zea mays]
MDFGRRKSFSFFEEDRKSSRPGAHTSTPVHQYYARAGGGGRSPAREPARLSMSSAVPSHGRLGVEVPLPPVQLGGGCSPWVQSPLHGRSRFPPSPAAIYHCLAALHRLEGDVHALAVARGVLFTASDSGRVRAWAAPGCFNRGYLDVGRGRVPALAACGGTLVTSHARDHRVRVWTVCAAAVCDHVRAKKAATLPAKPSLLLHPFGKRRPQQHRDTVSCLVLHAVAGLLYTASYDHTVKAWRLSDGSCVDSFAAHDGPVNAMVVNEADGCVFTGSADGTVKMWRRVYGGTAHALIIVLRSELSPVNALALCHAVGGSGGGATRRCCFLYAGCSDGYVNVWEKEATVGRPTHAGYLKGHRLAVFCLASGCGGRVVVSGSEDATMRVWRREGISKGGGGAVHTCLAVIEGHRGPVRCLAVGGGEAGEVEGSMVVYSSGLDKSVKVWRIRVVGKEEEDDDDEELDEDGVEDNDHPEAAVAGEIFMEGGKGDGLDAHAIPVAMDDVVDGTEDEEAEFVGSTPVLSPVWVEKRRHTSRG